MSFRLTREAEADILDIPSARRYPADRPGYGFLRPGLRRDEHASHSIYYRLTDTGILILRILHRRMDPARHL